MTDSAKTALRGAVESSGFAGRFGLFARAVFRRQGIAKPHSTFLGQKAG